MTSSQPVPALRVEGLTVSFPGTDGEASDVGGRRIVVDGVGFDLHRGRVLALVGESGSGKSVTAMSTLGLLPPEAAVSGSIEIGPPGAGGAPGAARGDGDTQLVGADGGVLRAVRGGRIGTIFQEPMSAFNPVIAIGAQIAEAVRAHGPRATHAEVRARVVELLGSAGVSDPERVRRAFPHELSGGQLQRAMIAMALSGDPDVLVADEPTTALDVTVQAGILDLLRSLRDRLGTAILLITHDMGVVADLADEVIVMRDGRIVERADATTLFAHPQADYTKALLAAVPRLGALEIGDRPVHPAVPGSDAEPHDAAPRDTAAAELEGVDIVYGGRRASGAKAVDGVSLRIGAGRMLGLVGESGSGKSTVGRALAGLVSPRAGAVRVAGIDLATARARDLRRARASIGYVFQDPASSLNPRSLVSDSVAEPLGLHSPLDDAGRRARVRDLLDAVRLPAGTGSRYPHELSGGQRQRVAIARAIALDPTLLLADEPTSALDVSVQARVLDLLRELQADLGFACLFISHDLAVVSSLVDEVAVMQRGRIVEQGAVDDVLRRPTTPYTQRLLASAPVADPAAQALRREAWRALEAADTTPGEPATTLGGAA